MLELGYLLPGTPPTSTLRQIAAMGPLLERLGYTRYWFAEHHAENLAYASPEPLVAHAAAGTERLRVGSAGVLMRVHSPLRVAEVFRVLATLHPGRIDLGVAAGLVEGAWAEGLCPGVDLQDPGVVRQYGSRVEELISLLGLSEIPPAVAAPPRGVSGPVVVCLGAGGGRGNMILAARHGLPFCYSLFHPGNEAGPEVIREYRERFVPSRLLPRPYVMLAGTFLCAETNSAALAQLRRSQIWEPLFKPLVLGRPARCRERIEELTDQFGADEFVLTTSYDGVLERTEAYHLLAEACGLTAP